MLLKKCLDFSTPGPKSLKNHKCSVETSSKILQKNCLDFSTPGPKSLKNHIFSVEKSSKNIPKNCSNFSDPMSKITQNSFKKHLKIQIVFQKNHGTENRFRFVRFGINCRFRRFGSKRFRFPVPGSVPTLPETRWSPSDLTSRSRS